MIRIAFIHTTGLSTGGTEQFLQRLAVGLPKDKYEVDFYYANNTDEHRKKYIEDNGIGTIKFECGKIIEKKGYAVAFDCNFDRVFKNDYDLAFLGTDGTDISYLSCIKDIPIIDSIHYVTGYNNRFNVARVMHISEFSKNEWVRKGGDEKRTVMISLPLKKVEFKFTDIRGKLGLSSNCFIFGMHQANRDEIFSDIPLKAFKEVENKNNAYVLLNGSKRYREQAKELGLKRAYFYDFVQDNDEFNSIIQSFNVYAHGRKDGELNSAAIAEAMSMGLPIISHTSEIYNGHLEVIKDNGFVANDYKEYAQYMREFENNAYLCKKCGESSRKFFDKHYDYSVQMSNIESIIEDVISNPFPNKIRRHVLSIKQKIHNYIIGLFIRIIYCGKYYHY